MRVSMIIAIVVMVMASYRYDHTRMLKLFMARNHLPTQAGRKEGGQHRNEKDARSQNLNTGCHD